MIKKPYKLDQFRFSQFVFQWLFAVLFQIPSFFFYQIHMAFGSLTTYFSVERDFRPSIFIKYFQNKRSISNENCSFVFHKIIGFQQALSSASISSFSLFHMSIWFHQNKRAVAKRTKKSLFSTFQAAVESIIQLKDIHLYCDLQIPCNFNLILSRHISKHILFG